MKRRDKLAAMLLKYKLVTCPNCGARSQPSDGNIVVCGACLETTPLKKDVKK